MSQVTVSKDKCIGCGACVAAFPEVFELDADGKSHAKYQNYLEFNYTKEDIESVCPVGAINVEE